MTVRLSDPASRFVNTSDVIAESGIDPATLADSLRCTFDLGSLEKRLLASDKLQDANVTLRSDGRIYVDVTPMVPVARVFDPKAPSYYINATGKRIRAELRYHIDVPVLVGSFDSIHPAQRLLPLLDKIANDPRIGSMIATVTQEADGNIILIPTIVGHVINFGDTSMVDDQVRPPAPLLPPRVAHTRLGGIRHHRRQVARPGCRHPTRQGPGTAAHTDCRGNHRRTRHRQ